MKISKIFSLGVMGAVALIASLSVHAEYVPAERQLDGVSLPAGYELLPFVSSTGAQYVDLGVTPDETVAYEITLRDDNLANNYSQQILGARLAFQNHSVAFSIQSQNESNRGWAWHLANRSSFSGEFYSGFNVVSFDSQHRVYVNGQYKAQLEIGNESATTGLNIYLFSLNNNGTPHAQYAKISLSRFKLWKGGQLVRDMVGAVNSANAVGLFDLVSEQFFVSVSGTALEPGHVFVPAENQLDGVSLPAGYTLLEHVSAATKGPYVDTGIFPDGTTRYELTASLGNTDEQFLLGSRDFSAAKWAFFAALSGKYAAGGYSTQVAAQKSNVNPDGFQVWSFSTIDQLQRLDGVAVNDFSSLSWPNGVTSTYSIYLFALNNAGTVHNNKSASSVRRLRIWQGGGDAPVLDYVPAKFGDEVGFYDLVSDEFITPVEGSGSLTAGPEIVTGTVLSFAADGNRGTVSATVDGSPAVNGAVQDPGSAVVLTATAGEGYDFAYWSGTLPEGASATANPLAFEMPDASASICAYFVSTNRVVPAGWTEPTNGVLLITFDDSAVDSWLAATNIFARYDAHASFAVIGDPSGYGSGGSKLMALKARGHTIGLHTWGHVNTDGFGSEPKRYFDEQVKPQLDKFAEMGHECAYMAYPNNKRTAQIDDYIRRHSTIRHFRAGEVASDSASPYWHAAAAGKDLAGNDAVFTPVACIAEMSVLNGMGCATAQYGTSVEVVKAGLGRIAANNEVMVLFSHDIQNSPSNVGMTPAMLEDILSKAKELGVRVVGVDEIPYVPVEVELEPDEPDVPVIPDVPDLGVVDLPAGYEQLKYVESTGCQYIDLGITPDSTMTCSLKFSYSGSRTDAVFFLGSRKAYQDHAFYLTHQSSDHGVTRGFGFARGGGLAFTELHEEGDHTALLTADYSFVLDGVMFGSLADATDVANDYPVYLFTLNNAGSPSQQAARMRLYSCTLTKGGETVRSLVPARHFGVVGLYDLVGNRFYFPKPIGQGFNDATIQGLVAGPEMVLPLPRVVPSGYTQLEYVSSAGGELLDTEIIPDDRTEMHIRLRPHDNGDVHMIGSRKAFQQQAFGLSNNGGFRMAYGTDYRDSSRKHLEEMVDISFFSRLFFVKGLQYGEFGSQTFTGTGPIYVFTVNNNGSPHNQYSRIDLAELQIVTNGVPAREYVAAKDANDALGLYDFVSGRFFTSSRGSLTGGPEVEVGDITELLEASDERWEENAYRMTLSRERSRYAGTSVTFAYGEDDAGEDLADWETSRVVGAFEQGERQIELEIDSLPGTARYGRLFTEDGVSEPLEIFTLVGRYASPALPTGYRAAEYIRSSAVQNGFIIDTGYIHRRLTRIECVAEVATTQPGGFAALFGSRLGSTWAVGGYAFFSVDNSVFVPRYSRSGDKVLGVADTLPSGTKVRIVTQGAKAEWFDELSGEKLGELTTTALIDDGRNSMAIFDLNDSPSEGGFHVSGSTAVMKLYSFRMADDNRVSRDFIPCLNEYGEPGLYEALTGTFHGNSGNASGVDFRTDLPTTDAIYTWTGNGDSADWSDEGNWDCSAAGADDTPGWTSTVVVPSGTWTINLDRPVGIKALDISAANMSLTLSSATSTRMFVNSNIVMSAGSSLRLAGNVCLCGRRGEDFIADGDGCVVEVKGDSELAFNKIVIGGAGSRLVVDDSRVTTEDEMFVRTTGSAATDGLWVRGANPVITIGAGFRADAVDAVLPVHFEIPVGGYDAAPIRSVGSGRCFSTWVKETNGYDSGSAVVFIEPKSPALKEKCSLDVPLVSFTGNNSGIDAANTQLSTVPQRTDRESFFYWTKQGDVYQKTSEVDQPELNVHIEGSVTRLLIIFK